MSYTPKVSGMYTVEVTVTDSDGETASGKMLINVSVVEPTEKPTEKPTERQTEKPTEKPTENPTEKPTEKPSDEPINPIPSDPADPVIEPQRKHRLPRARTGLNIKHKKTVADSILRQSFAV